MFLTMFSIIRLYELAQPELKKFSKGTSIKDARNEEGGRGLAKADACGRGGGG